jgi:hypothetical protein
MEIVSKVLRSLYSPPVLEVVVDELLGTSETRTGQPNSQHMPTACSC